MKYPYPLSILHLKLNWNIVEQLSTWENALEHTDAFFPPMHNSKEHLYCAFGWKKWDVVYENM